MQAKLQAQFSPADAEIILERSWFQLSLFEAV